MEFKDLYVNKLSIPKDTKIEIIIFYDDNISKILDSCIKTIENELFGKNIALSLIYVLSSYPFYSLRASIEENIKFIQEHAISIDYYKTLQNNYTTLINENEAIKNIYKTLQTISDNIKNEQEKLKKDFKELKEKFEKMEKEKEVNKNNDENKIENSTEENVQNEK